MSALSALMDERQPRNRPYLSAAYGADAEYLSEVRRSMEAALQQARPIPPPFDALSPSIGTLVASRWREPCEAAFEFIALRDPVGLLKMIADRLLKPADLTFAAEIAGRIPSSFGIAAVLRMLLNHPAAVVREGAIYGLARHLDAALRAELAAIAANDPSAAVRTAAADAIGEE